jgi:hypothetical protein
VNLAGLFGESMTLSIPQANDGFPLLLPATELDVCGNTFTGFAVQNVNQPLYSQVGAVAFSVTVGREAENLVPYQSNTFNLEPGDQGDAKYVVGVTLPQHLVLWKWERSVTEIKPSDLLLNWDSTVTTEPQKHLYFKIPGASGPPVALCLGSDGSDVQTRRNQDFTRILGALVHAALAPSPGQTFGNLTISTDAPETITVVAAVPFPVCVKPFVITDSVSKFGFCLYVPESWTIYRSYLDDPAFASIKPCATPVVNPAGTVTLDATTSGKGVWQVMTTDRGNLAMTVDKAVFRAPTASVPVSSVALTLEALFAKSPGKGSDEMKNVQFQISWPSSSVPEGIDFGDIKSNTSTPKTFDLDPISPGDLAALKIRYVKVEKSQ